MESGPRDECLKHDWINSQSRRRGGEFGTRVGSRSTGGLGVWFAGIIFPGREAFASSVAGGMFAVTVDALGRDFCRVVGSGASI